MISSPFLRCLQTAQQACNALELPGVHTFNGLCEIVAPGCNMRGPPEVPAMADVEACGITLTSVDSSPFAEYPEKVADAIARYMGHEQKMRGYQMHEVMIYSPSTSLTRCKFNIVYMSLALTSIPTAGSAPPSSSAGTSWF